MRFAAVLLLGKFQGQKMDGLLPWLQQNFSRMVGQRPTYAKMVGRAVNVNPGFMSTAVRA